MIKSMSVVFCLIIGLGLNAQKISPQVIASSGAAMKSSTINIEWTLGELSTETLKTPNFILTQGFHQPKTTVVSTKEISILGVQVYPNPAKDVIYISNKSGEELNSLLINTVGSTLSSQFIGHGLHELNIENLPAGHYFLQIVNGNFSDVYKIEKIR